MQLKELLNKRLEKTKVLTEKDCDELGLYGEDYCQLEYGEDEEEDDEDDW